MDIISLILLIGAIIFTIYGIIVYKNSSGTIFYRTWFALGMVSFFVFMIQMLKPSMTIPKLAKFFLLLLILLSVGSFLIIESKILSCFYKKGEANLDYLIVLGAQIYGEDPSPALQYRLDACYAYMTEYENTLCIVTGGQGSNEDDTEAHVMKKYLVDQGMDKNRILMEDTSVSTVENIRNSKKLVHLEDKRIGIVTNNFHLYRAIRMARKEGLTACGIAAKTTLLYLPNYMLREYFGLLKAMLKRTI